MSNVDVESLLSKPNTKAGKLQRACLMLLKEHEMDGALPTSGRFVFYELEGRGVIPKAYRDPDGTEKKRTPAQDISDALLVLREAGIVPWGWLVDETRSLDSWRYAASAYRYIEDILPLVRVDLWAGKPPPLIPCESRSLAGTLRDISETYLCPIAATNGQVGGFLHTDVAPLINGGVQHVYYFGDQDFCGNGIEENTKRVLEGYGGLEWERLAITEEQIDRFSLTTIQKPDHRFKPPKRMPAVETEALGQRRIQAILTERLDAELPEPLETVLEREEEQRVQVRNLLRRGE
jgi:hypothetical protein